MSRGVAEILSDQYGIEARRGKKCECPFCGRQTFSIKKGDQLGKCFHPGCGKFITALEGEKAAERNLDEIFQTMYRDFREALLGMKERKDENAYSYLCEERGIHPLVIEDSMLGAVPEGYDIEGLFAALIEGIEGEIAKAAETKEVKRGRPAKKGGDSAEERMKLVSETKEKLHDCLKGRSGWLCFFFSDSRYKITSVRMRNPYSKEMVYFKPFRYSGIFGHSLFTPFGDVEYVHFNELFLVTEGEFNHLQLQSLAVRMAGGQRSYVFAGAVGGVTNADFGTIKRICKNPIICYDHDEAGFMLVENARQKMTVRAFTTPKAESDLDDFIRSFGKNNIAAWEGVKELVQQSSTFPRYFESVARDIFRMRQKQGNGDPRRDFEIHLEVSNTIHQDLGERGLFYYEGEMAYYFWEAEKRLIEIHGESAAFAGLLSRYELNRSEKIFKYVLYHLYQKVIDEGSQIRVRRFAHYDGDSHTLYVSNHQNQMYRITPDKINLVDNGTDGVLFLGDDKSEPFELLEEDHTRAWLDEVIIDKINFGDERLTKAENRLLFRFWFYSLFFQSIMPTKPILAFIGPKGSGKSNTLRKVGMLLEGSSFDVMILTDDPKDFDAAVTNSHYVVLDNVDSKCRWLNDRLATVATGGSVKRRILYTTNQLMEIPTRSFLAITSRTPQFKRDDVADRLLIMKLERLEKFTNESKLLQEVLKNRNHIMTEVLHYLQYILKALRDHEEVDTSGSFRMADFASFSLKVARAMKAESDAEKIFEKLSSEQSSFVIEDDPIFQLLTIWTQKEGNSGRWISNKELCKEFGEIADKEKIDFRDKGRVKSFAQRMVNLRANLREFFEIGERTVGKNKRLYSFTPKGEDDVK